MKLLAPLLAVLLLPASAAAEQVPAAESVAMPEGGGCTYSWPASMVADVTETLKKDGYDAVETYTLSLKPREDGNFELAYSDFKFTEFQGETVTPAMEKDLAPVVAMASAIPTSVVSPKGVFVEIVGFDAMVDKVVAYLVEQKKVTREESAGVDAMMRSPGMRRTLEGTAMALWNGWIGDWVGMDLAPGASRDFTLPVDPAAPEGALQQVKLENLGPVAEHPGAMRFRLRIALEGDAARALMEPMLGPLLAEIPAEGQAEVKAAWADLAGSIVRTVETVTYPTTLRPVWVSTAKETKLSLPSVGIDRTQSETHEYTFAWRTP